MLNISRSKNLFLVIELLIALVIAATLSISVQAQTAEQSTEQNAVEVQNEIEVQHVTALEASEIIKNNPEIVILDVRTPVEFKLGRLENAVNINYYSFSFKNNLAKLDRDKTYLVHCQTGVRSGNTMPIMLEAGFTNLIHMDGGYKSWKQSNLPSL